MSSMDWIQLPDAALPIREENTLSRRYLRILEAWLPLAMRYFEEWPVRPNCGHFFGGVHWYGQETSTTIAALAAAASSPEYDGAATGVSTEALRAACLKGLRYLCFTHDTGPADCLRPATGLGRTHLAGTKWGQRGNLFFRESQCGRTIAHMLTAALLLRPQVDEETWAMLATVVADYMSRFEGMSPRTGVYNDTQTEENAWTAEGLACGALFLARHPKAAEWAAQAKHWMFCVATRPDDMMNHGAFVEGRTVRSLTGRGWPSGPGRGGSELFFTTLPDGLAENHGVVHTSYMACAVSFMGTTAMLYTLFGQAPPPHLFWRRRDSYDILKGMSDAVGASHALQGMDWEYTPWGHFTHTYANVWLGDSDAALLERRALDWSERILQRQGGRMVREDVARLCHGQQDPAIMLEVRMGAFTSAYLAHRIKGEGEAPADADDFERRNQGVRYFPHGGVLFHRHGKGQTSLSWRNRTMALPLTRDGILLVCPAEHSLLAQIQVKDRPASVAPVSLRVREEADRALVAFVEDVAQKSVRRHVLFATLPDGDCLVAEWLAAREDITVERVEQGYLQIRNEGLTQDDPKSPAQRKLFHPKGEETFVGRITGNAEDDVVFKPARPEWLNVDDKLGLVFQCGGETTYHNRRAYKVWRAVADDLVLSASREPRDFKAGDEIAHLFLRVCPEQSHEDTALTRLRVARPDETSVCLVTGSALAAVNFGETALDLEALLGQPADGEKAALFPGTNVMRQDGLWHCLRLQPGEAVLKQSAGAMDAPRWDGTDVRVDVTESGAAYVTRADGAESVALSKIGESEGQCDR